jgi:Uma2 family endonuclease
MASLPHSKTVTYEEWLRLPEVKREEVVDGVMRLMPAPNLNHADIVQNLYDLIRPQVDRREVRIYSSPFDLIIRRHPLTVRQPDLAMCVVSMIVQQDGRMHSAPELMAEVLSPSNTRKEIDRKLADCAGLGIPEAWVFSYEGRTVEVLYLENGQLQRQAHLAEGILKPRHFPHVQIDIATIWPD